MFGPTTTAGKIDEFETRFTRVNGADFFITANGKEAWPVSAAEAEDFKALYRRRMARAKWIRRALLIGPILLILLSMLSAALPDGLAAIVFPIYFLSIPTALAQHPITSDLTRVGIERRLKHRITTRLPAAITPALTPVGRFGRQLLFACVAIEIGMIAMRFCLPRPLLAEHMRILYRMGNGQEGPFALVTGNLAWASHYALFLAIMLLLIDRRSRRKAAEQAKAVEAAAASREARDAAPRPLAGHPRGAAFGRNVRAATRGGDGPGMPVSR